MTPAVQPGDAPPPLELVPETEDLVRWAAATDDYTTFHFDTAAARSQGLEGPVVHGTFQAAQIVRMLADWLGPGTEFRELACRYRRPALAGDPMRCTAEVVDAEQADRDVVEIEVNVNVESPPGRIVTTGSATVLLCADDAGSRRPRW